MTKKENINPLNQNSIDFINKIEVDTGNRNIDKIIEQLDEFILFPKQAIYMFDYESKKIVYSRGIEQVLGYNQKEFSLKLLINYIHPNQRKLLDLIMNASIETGLSGNFNPEDQYNLIYKVQHKNGQYIPILRQAQVIDTNSDGGMLANISLITDFTGMDDGNTVKWKLTASDKAKKLFNKALKGAIRNTFTKQEHIILQELKKGISSKIIADTLNISKHTVDKHRSNMIKKTGVKNTAELIQFSHRKSF
jgi:DNA-binding CsgD family transcriptional regulator